MAALALMILVTAILATGKAKTTFDIVVVSTFFKCLNSRSDPSRGVQEFHGPRGGTYCLSSFHPYHVSLRSNLAVTVRLNSSAVLYSEVVFYLTYHSFTCFGLCEDWTQTVSIVVLTVRHLTFLAKSQLLSSILSPFELWLHKENIRGGEKEKLNLSYWAQSYPLLNCDSIKKISEVERRKNCSRRL